MKKLLSCLLAILGLTTACGQKNYEDADVRDLAELIEKYDVVVLDVRTADEFKEGHIEKALNIDVKQDDFIEKATATLPKDKIIAVYCRSGRRSANAANQLSSVGYQLVNLKGGIMAWKDNNMPVTTANK